MAYKTNDLTKILIKMDELEQALRLNEEVYNKLRISFGGKNILKP